MVNNSTMLLLTTIGLLIVALALIIAFHQNRNATKGYRMRSLERERSQLLLEQEVLNMHIARSQALETLAADPKIQAMVAVKKPKYADEESSLAKRN